jgi:nucleotide-binding universal stress UspA family protein
MIPLRTVLCPVDFSPATPRQVDLAADLCRAFGARLVVHHNRHSLGTGASVGWMWNADRLRESQAALETRLRDCLARVPDGIAAEPLLTEGPVSRAVLAVSEAIEADLVVLTAHGTMADDHMSITERILESGERAVLVLHEPAVESRTPHFASASADPQVVLAATDLTPESAAAIELGCDLARRLPIELHLLHFVANGRSRRAHDDGSIEEARKRLLALVPEGLGDRTIVHAEQGDPATGIPQAAERFSASCIVMGEHARTPLRRWFGRDTSRAVLHQARCPVWYVPAAGASRRAATG